MPIPKAFGSLQSIHPKLLFLTPPEVIQDRAGFKLEVIICLSVDDMNTHCLYKLGYFSVNELSNSIAL